MKSFKRSRTSQIINFNDGEQRTKKIKLTNQDYEENIKKLADSLKAKEQSLRKKDSKTFMKKSHKFNIKNEIIDLELINYILNKSKKTENDILILKHFLSSMNFLTSLKGNFNIDKLLNSLSSNLKLEKISKDTLIFRQGNKGNKFYIILSGEVSILILKEVETKVEISFKRYFLHLILLKMLKEEELIKKSITANAKLKYHFDDKDFDSYYEKIVDFVNEHMHDIMNSKKKKEEFKYDKIAEVKNQNLSIKKNSFDGLNIFYFNKSNQNGIIDFKNSFNNLNDNDKLNSKRKTAKNLDIENSISSKFFNQKTEEEKEEEEKNEIEKIDKLINYENIDIPFFSLNDIKEIIHYYHYLKPKIDSMPKTTTVSKYIKNTYINSPFHTPYKEEDFDKKGEFTLLKYIEIKRKKAGESFGELALQREDNKRTGTIITSTDCTFGVLSRNDYVANLKDIDAKKRKNEINFMMSFSIFNKMNLIVFENKFFNFFTKENFIQGKNIIIQDQKIDKVFFIAEGQFEIMTNLSLLNLYSLLHHKTGKELDNEKLKKKFPKEEYNLRLYISQNKDILGLDDCCFKKDVSFITAKCLSDNGQAFTIDRTILNELRTKIPEIDKNIIKIIIKREKVMIDRLMNIYNRIVLSRNKSKNQQFNENNKVQDSFKYINYFFGINQGDKNSNAKKVKTQIANHKRVQSALFISQERKLFKLINEAETLNNDIYIDNNNSRFSIFKNNIARSKMSEKIKIIDALKFYGNKINEKSSPKEKSKIIDSNDKKDNLNSSLKLKQSEIMDSSIKSNDKMYTLKSSRINKSNKEKGLGLYDSLNKMIIDEYSKLLWVDNDKNLKKTNLYSDKRNNMIIKHKTIDKIHISNRFFSAFNANRRKIIGKSRPFSTNNENIKPFKQDFSSITKNVSNFNSDYEKDSKFSYSKLSYYQNKEKRLSRAITPDLAYPIKLKGKLNPEKFLKKMLGTRYKEQYISYEEQKFNKLIESFDIQNEFLNKSKLRLQLKNKNPKDFIKDKKEYKAYNSKLRDINIILKN